MKKYKVQKIDEHWRIFVLKPDAMNPYGTTPTWDQLPKPYDSQEEAEKALKEILDQEKK